MDAHQVTSALFKSQLTMPDPGNAGSIYVSKSPVICNLVSAAAETRTLARPTREGAILSLHFLTDGGDITLTVTGAYNMDAATTITFTDVGQNIVLQSHMTSAGVFFWRVIGGYVSGNMLGLTATVAEINRAAKNSTRPVAGGSSLTVTQALHDGKTIMLDTATGTAVTLPAMTGSGARYRFVCTVLTSGGTTVITATAANLFGGVYFNTDTAAGTLFTAVAAANATGSTTITLDGTTKGGRKGDWLEIEDLATSIGIVRGSLNGSGTEATPFA